MNLVIEKKRPAATADTVSVRCPSCNCKRPIPYEERVRALEVCPNCAKLFYVAIESSGLIVIDRIGL